ncbi:MAG TPA: helix-turn-helix transcriptional regulator [Candidatus Dormibacteraeota bacterium]|nr:helix-turn-helix transcriptional regulator [Candidatus Dormibacteraeota bacterium]
MPSYEDELRRFGAELKARREARGWSLTKMALLIQRAAERRGSSTRTDGNTVSRWERGRQRVDGFTQELISEVLGWPRSEMRIPEKRFRRRNDRADEQIVRMTLRAATIGLRVQAPKSMTADPTMATIEAFRIADRRIGGGHLYAAVASYLTYEIGPRLLAGGPNEFAVAASLTEMAGWMAHDAGRQSVAATHFEQAGHLARAGDVEDLAGDIDAAQAHLALYLGKPADALAIAERGRQHASRAPRHSGLVARLLAMEACAAAALGRKVEAVRLLHRSESELGRAEDDPSPLVSPYDEASLASEMARCLYLLGDHVAARQAAEHVLALRPSDRTRSRAFAQLSLALIAMAGPQPDVVEASTIGIEVLGASMALASVRVLHQLDELHRLLTPHRAVHEVADFLQRLEATLPRMKITYQLLARGELAT